MFLLKGYFILLLIALIYGPVSAFSVPHPYLLHAHTFGSSGCFHVQVHSSGDARLVQHNPPFEEESVCDDCHCVGPGIHSLLSPAVRFQHNRSGRQQNPTFAFMSRCALVLHTQRNRMQGTTWHWGLKSVCFLFRAAGDVIHKLGLMSKARRVYFYCTVHKQAILRCLEGNQRNKGKKNIKRKSNSDI